MSITADPVPSTYDVPTLPKPGVDDVLGTLRNARDRVAWKHARNWYINEDGSCCALGAIMVGDGATARDDYRYSGYEPSDAAIAAIRLLDVAAVSCYPELSYSYHALGARHCDALGARIEDVNQSQPHSSEEGQARVLRCYDEAIAMRKAELGRV